MRVAKKEMKNGSAMESLLRTCAVGRLATVDADGRPVIKPLNFVYLNGRIYFHSAKDGEKIDDIARDNRVCFEVDSPLSYVKAMGEPCTAGYRYQSVIVKGRARVVATREEKLKGLKALMEKYQPEGGYGDFIEKKLAITAVVAIEIEEMTGKEDLGR